MSDLADLVSGRLLVRALDDLHAIAEATAELPAMVDRLSEAVAATREVVALANAAMEGANASAALLAQMTEPLQVAASQLARLLERFPGLGRVSAP